MVKLIGFDTETVKDKYNVHRIFSIQIYSDDFGFNLFSTNFDDIKTMFTRTTNNAVILSANAQFDISAMIEKLCDMDFRIKCFYTKSRFVFAKVDNYKRYKWKIYDLFNLYPNFSLYRIARMIGMQKMEKPKYLGERKPYPREYSYFRQYALEDAKITYFAGKKILQEFGKIRPTIAGLGWKSFRKYQTKALFKPNFPEGLERKWFKAYKGGRTEAIIRGSIFCGSGEFIREYDVRSMYPHVMRNFFYPVISRQYAYRFVHKTDCNFDYEGLAKVTVSIDHEMPPLAVKRVVESRDTKNRPIHDKRLIFPEGIITDWFTYPELRLVEQENVGKIEKIHETYEWKIAYQPFLKFVDDMFEKRKRLHEVHDPFEFYYKFIMNTTYGRLAQHIDNQIIIFEKNKVERKRYGSSHKLQFAKNVNLIWASYITAYARLHLWKQMKRIGFDRIIYCDTDSIFTTKRFLNTSNELGELKEETKMKNITVFRAKSYITENQVKMKGLWLPLSPLEMRAMIFSGNFEAIGKVIPKIREALRRGLALNIEIAKPYGINIYSDGKRKYHKELNHKRVLVEYTESEPLRLDEKP